MNNAFAGPGHQSLTDYEHAAVEGFVTNSIGLVCPACASGPIASAITTSGPASSSRQSTIWKEHGAQLHSACTAALTGAASIAPYPFEGEFNNYFMKKH